MKLVHPVLLNLEPACTVGPHWGKVHIMIQWLQWLKRPTLDAQLRTRLDAWRSLPPLSKALSIDKARMILVDVESTGLDPVRDHLLAIGAIPVDGGHVRAGDGFEKILEGADFGPRDTILIHGITPTAIATGEPPQEVLMDFLEYAGKYPLVAYHAGFDQAMLGRALRKHLGVRLNNPWIDLAWLAPALLPELGLRRKPLDAWLDHFHLRAHTRHRALADCLVSGELMLILLDIARKKGLKTVGDLMALEKMEHQNSQSGLYGGI